MVKFVETLRGKRYSVISEPLQHILIDSGKELHGWWPGKRECTDEKMLINPYNGCSHNCFFCYANAFEWDYFNLYRQEKVITVCKNFDEVVARQLDSIDVAACGYLSPMTDPFQPINKRYHLSEKIIQVFIERNLPIEFITKGVIPKEVIELIKQQKHSYGQVTILTPREEIRRKIAGGASTEQLFDNLKRLSSAGKHAVCRIDPIIPYVTDGEKDLEALIKRAKQSGATHVIASCVDIPKNIAKEAISYLYQLQPNPPIRYEKLFNEIIDGRLNADIGYRKRLFSMVRELCKANGLSFSLCGEFEKIEEPYWVETGSGKKKLVRWKGLNEEFMFGTTHCEGIGVPLYIRKGKELYIGVDGKPLRKFEPVDCEGGCLSCKKAKCGIEELAMGRKLDSRKDFYFKDYRRWTEKIRGKQLRLFDLNNF